MDNEEEPQTPDNEERMPQHPLCIRVAIMDVLSTVDVILDFFSTDFFRIFQQKREVALNTFLFPLWGIPCAGGIDETKDPSENFYQLPVQITVCMPKKAVLILLRDRQDRYMKNTPCTSNPASVQTM